MDYRQIVGDVITINTTTAYGMKGFLIQSGKESIMKSLKDVSLSYGYLHSRNVLDRAACGGLQIGQRQRFYNEIYSSAAVV